MDLEADLRSMMSDREWQEVMDTAFRMMKELFENSPNPPTSLEEMGVALEMLGETFPEIPNPSTAPLPTVPATTLRSQRCRVPGEVAAPISLVQPFKAPAVPSCLHLNNKAVGLVNTEAVNGTQTNTAPDTAADPPPNISQRMHDHDYSQPYIKKPSNAFMIFRKEQSPVVAAELQQGDSASVNTILGQRWKALSKDQQAKYYNLAEMERTLHNQLHPEWSSSDNYGKNRKRGKRGKRNVPNWTK